MSEPTETAALAARIQELEAEIDHLREHPHSAPAPNRWRTAASAVIIVVAALLVPVSIITAWARLQLVDEDAFVTTLAPLVDDPAVQELVIDETMDAIRSHVDFSQVTSDLVDGIAELGLPPRAASALRLLEAPAASGLQNLVESTVANLIRSDAFADIWTASTRAAHRAITLAATSDGGGIVVTTRDGLALDIGAIVAQAKQALLDRGVGVAQIIPTVDRVIVIGTGENLSTLRTAHAVATAVGWWLPLITLALLGAAVLLARRRSTATLGSGIAIALGAGALIACLDVGHTILGNAAGELDLSPPAVDAIYRRLTEQMAQSAVALLTLGIVAAALGWAFGHSRPATWLRTSTSRLNASTRRGLLRRGVDTGKTGEWLARHRVLLRAAVVALAVIAVLLLRPLTPGDVLLVFLTAGLASWILEILQRRDLAETSEPQQLLGARID